MDQFNNALNIARILLGRYEKSQLTDKVVEKEVKNVFLYPGFENVRESKLLEFMKAELDIHSGEVTMLVEKDVNPWLKEQKSEIEWGLWNRYKSYLLNNQGFPSNTISDIDDVTDKILDKCIDPTVKGAWDRRGMVVGNVQSGKTANYMGLINKATDAGYKLIIVIAGIHNTLRSQTQIRVDEGYIGRNSSDFIQRQKNVKIGVGKYPSDIEIYSYTSSDNKGDFNRPIATKINVPIGGKSPTVLVIKKNKSILENLILWLNTFAEDVNGQRKILDVPLLIIDDEADNASVNSGTEIDVRTINRLIRTLLNLFNRNTFIGYTATPYANLYIPSTWRDDLETMVKGVKLKVGEDLFPRDFIVNIKAPSNYIGAATVFGFENKKTGELREGLNIIRNVDDNEDYFPRLINKDNKNDLPDDLPNSLKNAVKAFIITCAVRRLRGQKYKHSSMLIHVALRVLWIDKVAWLVNDLLRDYTNQINSGQGNLLIELEYMFINDFKLTTQVVIEEIDYNDPIIDIHSWDEVKTELKAAVTKIEVRSVHGLKKISSLEYHNIEEINYDAYKKQGLSVIAVGGNKLARGITLEGLSISYYLRTTRMYDSLMQMGRWFGYRPGYVDLCRLYTTENLVNWYRHVTMATEEMREDFDELASNPQMRPIHYQLKVRTHSGMLSITSVSKMREHERIQVGFSGDTKQTYQFDNDQLVVNKNFQAFKSILSKMSSPNIQSTTGNIVRSLLFKDVNSEAVIDFLEEYTSFSDYIRTDILKGYIEAKNKSNVLKKWSVAIILNSSKIVHSASKHADSAKFNGLNVLPINLKWKDGSSQDVGMPFRFLTGSRELSVPNSKNAILDATARMIDLELPKSTPVAEIKIERNRIGKPLLVLMPLDPRVSSTLNKENPIIGFGILFPKINNEETYEYAARPKTEDFEELVQTSDDPADLNE
tara:strand:+ start:1919 stop:4732 length:2814 start_codon:yes stop_codon:yes gene_type:complete